MKISAILYISYDGLLDPLGGSQILPYLYSIASHPRPLHIVSFEKPARFVVGAVELRAQLAKRGIVWTPLSFTTRFGKLGKAWDLLHMYITCLVLHLRHKFDAIHCRSYQAMQVGCMLHQLTGVRTIFDMRGLWVDERLDGGLWSLDHWLDKQLYFIYKRIERHLLLCASHVVVLTDRVVPELKKLSRQMMAPVTVIPCCADFEHFMMPSAEARRVMRAQIGVKSNARLISYLGSLGTWYMLEDILRFFAEAVDNHDDVHLMLITRDWCAEHEVLVKSMGLDPLRSHIHVRPATRDQVPGLLGASDVMLSFIKPAYSKIASSPTKLAEAFAVGVPVISNAGVGDVDQITQDLDAGVVFDLADASAMKRVVVELDLICQKGGKDLRDRARLRLGLEFAESAYHQVYKAIEETL